MVFFGFDGNDKLTGTSNSDTLHGGNGSDRLEDGTGDDILVGGAGDDYLVGGLGSDTFVVTANLGFELDVLYGNGFDKIVDFSLPQGDKLNLSALFFDEVSLENLSDYVSFEWSSSRGYIVLSIDRDGVGSSFDKTAMAHIYASNSNITAVLNEFNQGVGAVL